MLDELKHYLDEQLLALSNTSALAQAIGYLTKIWASFCRYTTHDALSIDNNAVERDPTDCSWQKKLESARVSCFG